MGGRARQPPAFRPRKAQRGTRQIDISGWIDMKRLRLVSAVIGFYATSPGQSVTMAADVEVNLPLKLEKHYLNLPVKNGAPGRHLTLLVDGQIAREFDIELADGPPDWWTFVDLTPFKGRTAALMVDRLPEDLGALKLIGQSDAIKGSENLYHE